MTEKVLYQHGTLGALMAGLMDGTTSIAEVLKYGTLGLGTLHGLDGEVIFLDGEAYQGRSDGALIHLSGEESTPYAAITAFSADRSFAVKQLSSEALKEQIMKDEAGKNLFLAVKISGLFKDMHIRIMPKQEKPYRRLAKISESQPEFHRSDIQGTIVGFYTPELFQGVAAAGFHLHFIDDEKTFGGHILDFDVSQGTVEISQMESLMQHFPTNDPTFIQNEIDYADLAAEIEQAE